MNELDDLLATPADAWLGALPQYQRDIMQAFLADGASPDAAGEKWVAASGPENTFPFGGTKDGRSLFYEKLVEEAEAFLCGHDKYETDRARFLEHFKPTHVYVVSGIATVIGPAIGAAAPLIAPAVAMILVTVGRLGLNAWCAVRRERRKNEPET